MRFLRSLLTNRMTEITIPGDITSIKITWNKVHVGEVVWGCTADVACEPYGSNDKCKYYQAKKGVCLPTL